MSSPTPLHLLRALLRECTYLPDPVSRSYMHRYVVSSYRVYCPQRWLPCVEVPPARRIRLLHRARKSLSLLRRANHGQIRELQRVLLLTYGRIGKRRHEFMKPLIALPVPKDHKAVETLSPASKFDKDWKLPEVLEALLRSQASRRDASSLTIRPQVKQVKLEIPQKNAWGRPMPLKRKKNIARKWYAQVLDCVLPPLPQPEWELLQSLARDGCAWKGPQKRRPKATTMLTEEVLPALPALTDEHIIRGSSKGQTFEPWSKGRPHRITKRLMMKIWRQIFELVPLMMWNTERGKWTVSWGLVKKPRPAMHFLSQHKSSVLFDGVSNDGKVFREGNEPLPT